MKRHVRTDCRLPCRFARRPVAVAVLLLVASSGAGALPAGGQVVGGAATIQTPAAGQQLVTQGTQRAIIDWTSFSIGSGETVRFAQPSSTSLVLNRVTGYDPSRILGQLQANGRVFLLNPYGVVFGAGARVDVGALVASTLNLSNADFLAGLYRLNSNDGVSAAQRGAVVNEGAVSAPGGTVALVGPQVSNRGTIDAPLGRVGLGAADQVLVDVDGGGLVLFQVAGAQATNKLEQLGQIRADGGSVELQAAARAALTDTVLNLDGVVQARGLGTRQGRVVIDGGDAGVTRVAGTVDVSGRAAGEQGGRAEVLGHDVLVDSTARIDARGDAGGGAVRIGGDWQGQGELRHADQTIVAAGASIDASALARGDGGSVVVWSDTSTQYYGSIAARGGALGGDGGAVETSGKAFLTLAGSVDASAPFGANGQWLLDPFNVTIGNAATDTGVKVDATTFTANTNNTNIKASDLESALAGGTNVTVSTGTSGTQAGDISVATNIQPAVGAGKTSTLTLSAAGSISIGNGDQIAPSSGSLNVNLYAGVSDQSNAKATAGTNASTISFGNATSEIDTAGGNLTMVARGNITLEKLSNVATLDIDNKGTGTITLNQGITTTGDQIYRGAVAVGSATALAAGAGKIDLQGTFTATNDALTLTSTNSAADAIHLGGAVGGVTLLTVSGKSTLGANVTTSGNQSFSDALTLAADATLAAGAGTIGLTSVAGGGHALTLASTNAAANAIATSGAISGVTTLDVNGKSTLGGNVTTSGNQTFGDVLTLGADATLDAGAGQIGLASVAGGSHALTLASTGTAADAISTSGTISGVTTLAVNGKSTLGANVTTSGNQSYSAALTLGADAVLDAGSGLLALGGAVTGGSHALQLKSANAAANAIDLQAVSGVTSFTVTGKSTLHGSVTSTGQQTYSDTVVLGADVAFSGVGVNFQGTLDGAHAASVTAGTGTAAFGANVGAGSALTQLAVTADTITFAGTATGAAGATAVLAPFSAGQGVSIAGGSTSDATPLTIDNTMLGLFAGFTSLTLGSASGSAGVGVGAFTLPTATTVRSGTGNIVFSTVDGAKSLTVNTGGTTTFGGAVGGGTALASLTTDAPGTTHIGAPITTNGAQTFNDPVVLDTSVTLAGGSVTFGSTLAGLTGGETLAVNSGGVTHFGGNVTQLATLTTDATGSTEFGANVTTSGAQTYNDNVVLTANATLTAPAIAFGGSVGLGSFELDLNADTVTFPLAPVFTGTGTLGLAPYSASTTIGIAGGAGTFQVPQTLLDSFTTLSALAIGRSDGSGAVTVGVAGGAAMTPPTALTLRTGSAPLDVNVNVTGTAPFSIASSGGPIDLNGITVDTGSAPQAYSGPVVLGTNGFNGQTQTQLNGSDITLTGSVDAAVVDTNSLLLNATGLAGLLGGVGSGGRLGFLWSQNAAGSNEIGGNISANGIIRFDGSTHLAADATLASLTNYVAFLGTLDGAHALTLNTPATTYFAASIGSIDPLSNLSVPGAVQLLGNVAVSGGTLAFLGGVNGAGWSFAPNASVATRLAGSLNVGSFSATGPAVLLGDTTVAASSIAFGSTIDGPFALALNSAGTTTLGGAIGSSAPLTGLTTDAGGTTHLGANVTASGALGFNDAVVVDANATLAAGPAGVSFASTVDGPGALVVNTGGTTSFAGVVGSSTPLGGLTTDAAGSTTTHGVIASGAITFNDIASLGGTYATGGANFTAAQAVTLTAATTIDAGVGNVGFGGSVDGGNALSVASNGATSFAGTVGAAVALTSLATDAGGTTALSGNVFTVGTQHYGDAVTLTGNRFLLGSSLAFDAALALGSGNVVLAADTMSFGPTLSGSGSLIVEPLNAGTTIGLAGGAGTLQLTSAMLGQLGGLSALTIGNSGDSGTINAGALTLPTATTIVSGSGDVNFGAITGAHSLDVQTGGVTRFGGAVSGLTALSTDLFGSTELGAAISVAGPVTFADAVTLAGASSVSGTVVDFGATVNGPFALAATGTTQVRFDAAVGGVTPLAGLSTSGPTRVAGNVTTSGAQAYQGALTLAAASTSLGGTDITFGGTVDGATSDANALAINASGVAALHGSVGSTTRLASLSASGGSATIGGNISAAGNVQFNDPAQLTADATLASATGYVAFVGPLDGVHALTTSAGAFSYFGSTVGATTPLTSLTTQGSDVYVSAVQANNTLQTSGAQTYNGTVHLLNNTSFSGSALAFLGGVDGAAWTFATNGTTATQLTGTVNVGTLAASGPVQLVGDTTLSAALANFGSTVDGAFALTADVGGTTTFSGAVGATTPLTSLTVLGDAQLDGSSFSTTGAQSYQQAVSLGADSTFTATTLQLGGTTLAINNHELDLHVDSFTLAPAISGGVSISLAPASAATAISIAFAGGTADPTDFEVPQATIDQFSGFNLVKIGRADGTGAVAVSNLTLPTNLRLQSGTGNVTLQGSVDTAATAVQPSDLTIATGGTTTVSGPIGATHALGTLDIAGAAQLSGGSLIAANGLVFEAGFGANAGAVAFVSDALSVTGPVGASAALSFAPYTVSAGIGVAGGAGALQLPQTLLDQLTGAASLTIGRVDGSGPIEVGAFVVPTATRLHSGSGNVAFTGPVDSATGTPRSMTVATGGTTTLPAQLGATTPLGSFSVLGASALGADTTLTASTISFGTSVSGPHALTLDGSLQLINNLAISGTDVRFQSIDGAFGLTVNASGASTFAGPVGAGTPLASLVTDAAGTTHLASSIQASGTIQFNDAVVLDANASVAAGTAPGADSVLFGQAVDGGFGLTVSSAGPAHFAGSVGAGTSLASLASAGTGDVTFDVGSVTTTGAQSYAGLVHLPAGTTLQGAALELAGGGSAHGDLTLLTESLALGAPLAGSGQVAIAPRHAGDSIGLGSAGGTLSIGQSVLDRLAGFDQLLVGRADGSGDLTAQAAVLPMTTTLQGGSGEIRLAGRIDGAVDLTLATGGVTSLVGDIGTNVALRSLHVTDEATHANWDGSAGERTLVEGGAPVRIVTSGTQLYDEPLLASTTLSLQADSVKLPQAVGALTLGDVRLANGGSITSSGVLQLAGALQLDGGTLMLSSTATPTAASITDPEYAGEGLLFRNALLRENSAAIEQLAGSTIRTAAGSLLALRSPGNGSILIDQAGNQLAGGLSAVTGTPGDNDATRFNVAGSLPLGIVRIAADQLNAAGRFNGDATAPDLGIEADAVHITADRLSTGAGGLIRARLPFDNTQGSQTSLPALTLTLTPGTYTLTGPYGSGAAPASWIQVKLGDQDGGFVTLRPKGDAVTHPDLFVFLAGDPQPRPFYDGSGKTTEIPIFYNGDTPRTPQEVGALNAVTAVVENARRARFEEAVRTENVTSRLRQGVIAEVGAGRPATEGSGTMHMPEPCPVKPGTLECQ